MIDLKLKKLDWYIIRKFLITFLMAILIVITIVIIFDISEKIDKFVEYNAPLKDIIFKYYVNYIPYFINMFSPLFVFLTVIFFTSVMAQNSEIIAILSGGISYRRMMVPYMVAAAVIALFSFALNLYVVPRSNVTRLQFEQQYVRKRDFFNQRNIHYQIAPGQYVYVDVFSNWNNTAYKFTIEDIENGKIVSKLSAESAEWDTTFNGWKLRNYFIRDYNPSGLSDRIRESGDVKDTVIALTIDDFQRNEKTVEKLTIGKLNELISVQKMRGDPNVMYAQIEKQRRMTLPFSVFILTIMAVALTSRKKRGGIGWNIAIGIGLAFTYILFLRFSEMFVYAGALPPGIAMWLPNIVYLIVTMILYRMAPK